MNSHSSHDRASRVVSRRLARDRSRVCDTRDVGRSFARVFVVVEACARRPRVVRASSCATGRSGIAFVRRRGERDGRWIARGVG